MRTNLSQFAISFNNGFFPFLEQPDDTRFGPMLISSFFGRPISELSIDEVIDLLNYFDEFWPRSRVKILPAILFVALSNLSSPILQSRLANLVSCKPSPGQALDEIYDTLEEWDGNQKGLLSLALSDLIYHNVYNDFSGMMIYPLAALKRML
jgi:hypothetical protein